MPQPETIHRRNRLTNIISVDFRRSKLSIDGDPYLKNVTEIHCRHCNRRKAREGAKELRDSWGYVCSDCKVNVKGPKHSNTLNSKKITFFEKSRLAEPVG